MYKKIKYILDREQKIKLFVLLIVILVGALVELLGVSSIMPLIDVATNPDAVNEKWYLVLVSDTFGFSEVKQIIAFLALVLVGVYIVKNLYISMMYSLQYRFIFNNQRRLAVKMMNAYMHQNYLFHVSRNVAELQRNVTEDVNGFYTVVLNAMQFIAEASVCIVLVVYLMRTDVMTTLVVAALVFVFAVLVGIVFKKTLVKKGKENRSVSISLTKWVLQSFSGIKEIKVMNREGFFLQNYESTYRRFTVLQRQQSMLTFIPRPIMETVCVGGLLLTMAVKVYVLDTDLTEFVPALSVFAIAAFRMLPSFNRISGYMSAMMFNRPAIDVLYDDLVEIEKLNGKAYEENGAAKPLVIKNGISIKNVSFQYPASDRQVLKNLDLEIKNNTSVALIGASGAGKSTLADVILGVLEPQSGSILVDGKDISQNMGAWHAAIGYIPQAIYLMDDTIRANVAFGIEEGKIDEAMLWKALHEAQLEEFVKDLPDGLDTMIGDRGVKLSGGQRQRIGIARALYGNPQVLILDEATSALDNETEKEVMDAIDSLHGTRTLIVIAHRLTTIRKCDKIYEVGNGTIRARSKEEVFGG
ncbi:MAG: ABC transporter ATP-binding protein/permease [Lachnospiraceae bacterium]|nr:ABC transporter ATP-binding protein/permease [Lachnospiraceae bacterium]